MKNSGLNVDSSIALRAEMENTLAEQQNQKTEELGSDTQGCASAVLGRMSKAADAEGENHDA